MYLEQNLGKTFAQRNDFIFDLNLYFSSAKGLAKGRVKSKVTQCYAACCFMDGQIIGQGQVHKVIVWVFIPIDHIFWSALLSSCLLSTAVKNFQQTPFHNSGLLTAVLCVCVCVCEVLFPLRYAQKQYLREHDPGDKNEKPYIFKPPGQSAANRASDSKTAAATVSHQCSLSCLC